MLRIFRVDHQKELSIQNPRFQYVDITKNTDIRKEYINVRPVPKIKDTRIPLYLDNYVIWNEDGLFMKCIQNELELNVEESELPKTFYGYYELRDAPVIVFYFDDEELEFLKSKNKATRVKYVFFDEDEDGKNCSSNWFLVPGHIHMGMLYVLKFGIITERMKNGSRVFYFTDNGRLYCGTVHMHRDAAEAEYIVDCAHSYYDISENVSNFDIRDSGIGDERNLTKVLASHLEVPLKFLDETFQPDDKW